MGPGDSPSCPKFGRGLQRVRDAQGYGSPDRITESYLFGRTYSFGQPSTSHEVGFTVSQPS
jgi:hypothetical protein